MRYVSFFFLSLMLTACSPRNGGGLLSGSEPECYNQSAIDCFNIISKVSPTCEIDNAGERNMAYLKSRHPTKTIYALIKETRVLADPPNGSNPTANSYIRMIPSKDNIGETPLECRSLMENGRRSYLSFDRVYACYEGGCNFPSKAPTAPTQQRPQNQSCLQACNDGAPNCLRADMLSSAKPAKDLDIFTRDITTSIVPSRISAKPLMAALNAATHSATCTRDDILLKKIASSNLILFSNSGNTCPVSLSFSANSVESVTLKFPSEWSGNLEVSGVYDWRLRHPLLENAPTMNIIVQSNEVVDPVNLVYGIRGRIVLQGERYYCLDLRYPTDWGKTN